MWHYCILLCSVCFNPNCTPHCRYPAVTASNLKVNTRRQFFLTNLKGEEREQICMLSMADMIFPVYSHFMLGKFSLNPPDLPTNGQKE